uniref:uncharacterized protein LOC120346371 n=1 Tax=Styela clava TaxID=7725 RepID=UPI0019399F2A|nr:uncharacterized protein LOC120346371 [Styela clava]
MENQKVNRKRGKVKLNQVKLKIQQLNLNPWMLCLIDGKSKSKSKKKKSQTQSSKIENTTIESQPMDAMFDSGEWKTVSTKEQRERQKREKRKLQADVAVAVETADKASLVPLVQPVYKPTPNISAIAKVLLVTTPCLQ